MKKPLSYVFDEPAFSEMRNFIDTATLFAFDLDGTLAPIVPKPSSIGISDAIRQALTALNAQATVAVITGRSRSDALYHLGLSPRYLIGNHGSEGLPGWEDREHVFSVIASQWESRLEELLPIEHRDGIMIENKGATLSIHYRLASDVKNAHKAILTAVGKLIPEPRRIGGQFVENLLPAGSPDKGIAFRTLMEKSGCRKGFFVGDDETDERVFQLKDQNIFTVRIGINPRSDALFYLHNQHEITRLMGAIHHILREKADRSTQTNTL